MPFFTVTTKDCDKYYRPDWNRCATGSSKKSSSTKSRTLSKKKKGSLRTETGASDLCDLHSKVCS